MTAMQTITSERTLQSSQSVSSKQLCLFLADYSSWLLGCGATCIRLETNVKRIAAAYGYEAELTIMPRHINLTVALVGSDDVFTSMTAVRHTAINFDMNTRLSNLSWRISDRRLSLAEARRMFNSIVRPRPRNEWALILIVAVANAAFCRLFGGDAAAMAVVFLATFAGFMIKQTLVSRGADVRLTVIFCAFVSSVLGSSALLFGIGATPRIALATSVLYLVPGIPFINSFSDLLYRHYICAFSRFVDAIVLTCCLSIGLCAGMMMMNVGMFE